MINKNIFEELISLFAKHNDIFHLEHPIGSAIRQANIKNYLVVFQGVSIGGNLKMEYPTSEEGVVFFLNSTLIGSSQIGNNSAIGAVVQLYNKNLSENSAVSLGIQKVLQ